MPSRVTLDRSASARLGAKEFIVELLTETLPSMRAKAATAESPLFPKGISLIAIKANVSAFGEVSLLLAGSDAPEIDPFSLLEDAARETNGA